MPDSGQVVAVMQVFEGDRVVGEAQVSWQLIAGSQPGRSGLIGEVTGKARQGICGIFPPRLRGFPPDGPQARPSNIAPVPPRVWRLAGQRSVGIPRRGTEATRRREAL